MNFHHSTSRGQSLRRACILFALLNCLIGCETSQRTVATTASPGVRPPAAQKTSSRASANTDPCATRLHDLCLPLLLYYAQTQHRLPPTLAALKQSPGFDPSMQLTCPISNLPYLYDPEGIPAGANKGRAILYDPLPSHEGMRWAISIIEPEGDGPLIAKVISMPESAFTSRTGP